MRFDPLHHPPTVKRGTMVYADWLGERVEVSRKLRWARRPASKKKIDITGKRCGRLVVLKCVGVERPSGEAVWLCQCDCGKRSKHRGYNLRTGRTKSCGCLQGEKGRENLAKVRHKRWLRPVPDAIELGLN